MTRLTAIGSLLLLLTSAFSSLAAPSVRQLMQQLHSEDPSDREQAALALGRYGTRSSAALPRLVALLNAPDSWVRRAAIQAIANIETTPNNALKGQLIRGSAAPEFWVRNAAITALAKLFPSCPEVLAAISRRLSDANPLVRRRAARALRRFTGLARLAVPQLVARLGDENYGVMMAVSRTLGQIGTPALRALRGELQASDRWRQRAALFALFAMGPKAAPLVSQLRQRLEVAPAHLQVLLVRVLGRIGPAARPAVSRLANLLHSGDQRLKQAAIIALGQIGKAAAAAYPALVATLTDRDPELRRRAAAALKRVGRPSMRLLGRAVTSESWRVRIAALGLMQKWRPKQALARLLRASLDSSWQVRRYAITALRDHSLRRHALLPVLQRALRDRDWRVVLAALGTLGSLGPLPTLADLDLQPLLHSRFAAVRVATVQALARLGPAITAALPALMTLLDDVSEPVRRAAHSALLAVRGPLPQSAIAPLRRLLTRPGARAKWVALRLLAKVSPGDASLLPQLLRIVGETADGEIRLATLRVLAGWGRVAQRAAGKLLLLLRDDDWRVRHAAIVTLARVAPRSPRIVAALHACMTDGQWLVRSRCASALGQLGQGSQPVMLTLLAALEDRSWMVRRSVIDALGAVNVRRSEVFAGLRACLNDDLPAVRRSALKALVSLRAPALPALLTRMLGDSAATVRMAAVERVLLLPAIGRTLRRALQQAANDRDPHVRRAAKRALRRPAAR